MTITYTDIAKMIDHSLLAPNLTERQLEAGCRLAAMYDVATVCIMPYFVERCAKLLSGSGVLPTTTIGFPHGAHRTALKQAESLRALDDGAKELDMVVNISKVLSGDWQYVEREIAAVLETVRAAGARLKVIFENCYLEETHKIQLCKICGELGVDWVKTSTGFGPSGATPDDVRLMREHSPEHVQVKAAGGIRDLDSVMVYRQLGATRIGASRTADILDELRSRLGLEPLGGSASDTKTAAR
ncbi:MAG: deoxyribose-phosphate aldolase [Pirellulaceae bacterium]|nr:MAG: deoxyribose-phosphate aldolase [Pirellulaceae bacterium]